MVNIQDLETGEMLAEYNALGAGLTGAKKASVDPRTPKDDSFSVAPYVKPKPRTQDSEARSDKKLQLKEKTVGKTNSVALGKEGPAGKSWSEKEAAIAATTERAEERKIKTKPNNGDRAQSRITKRKNKLAELETSIKSRTSSLKESFANGPNELEALIKDMISSKRFVAATILAVVYVALCAFASLLFLTVLLPVIIISAVDHALGLGILEKGAPIEKKGRGEEKEYVEEKELGKEGKVLVEQEIDKRNQLIEDFLSPSRENERSVSELIGGMKAEVYRAARTYDGIPLKDYQRRSLQGLFCEIMLTTGFLEVCDQSKRPEQARAALEKFKAKAGGAGYDRYDGKKSSGCNKILPFWGECLEGEARDLYEKINKIRKPLNGRDKRFQAEVDSLARDLQGLCKGTARALRSCLIAWAVAAETAKFPILDWGFYDVGKKSEKYIAMDGLMRAISAFTATGRVKTFYSYDWGDMPEGGYDVERLARAADILQSFFARIRKIMEREEHWPSKLLSGSFVDDFRDFLILKGICSEEFAADCSEAFGSRAELKYNFGRESLEPKREFSDSLPSAAQESKSIEYQAPKAGKDANLKEIIRIRDKSWYDLWSRADNERHFLFQMLRCLMPSDFQRRPKGSRICNLTDWKEDILIAAKSFADGGAGVNIASGEFKALKELSTEEMYRAMFWIIESSFLANGEQKTAELFNKLRQSAISGKIDKTTAAKYDYEASLRRIAQGEDLFQEGSKYDPRDMERVYEFMRFFGGSGSFSGQNWSSELGRSRLLLKALCDAPGISLADLKKKILPVALENDKDGGSTIREWDEESKTDHVVSDDAISSVAIGEVPALTFPGFAMADCRAQSAKGGVETMAQSQALAVF